MKKKSLIIPDIHLKWERANRIIKNVDHDEIVFLGDYFDDFNDTPEMVNEMVDWLEHSVKQPNRIHLYGNHDIHYAVPDGKFACSGYEQWKMFIIRDRLKNKFWDNLKFFHILDGTWICSHAGIHDLNLPQRIKDLKDDRSKFLTAIEEYLDEEIIKGYRGNSWIFGAGRARCGMQRVGGIIWCDFEKEFKPITGLNQIVGHTPIGFGMGPKWINTTNKPLTKENLLNTKLSYNVDLDNHGNMCWAVWDGEMLTTGKYSDL